MFKPCIRLVVCAVMLGIAGDASADLVAHWRFDDGAGTVAADMSKNGNDGTFRGNPLWVAGKLGGALRFNGNGDYVHCGTSPVFDIRDEITLAIWVNANDMGNGQHNCWMGKGDNTYAIKHQSGNNLEFFIYDGNWHSTNHSTNITSLNGQWHHMAGTFDGTELKFYLDGEQVENLVYSGRIGTATHPVTIGENSQATGRYFDGMLDDARIYNNALSQDEIKSLMLGEVYPLAFAPKPADGAIHPDTWVTLSWRSGDFAASHDVYLGDNFADVNAGTGGTFQGNQTTDTYLIGFFGYPYPDGLVPGTTYYWRIDEVNTAKPDSPWKGPVWSFSIPPRTAYRPNPADGAQFVPLDSKLSWAPGFGAKLHTIYLGQNFDDVNNAVSGGSLSGTATYSPPSLKAGQVYYWRVDEMNPPNTYKGPVWSFTTPGAVGNPHPANGNADAEMNAILTWTPSDTAVSHQVYFGTSKEAVRRADTSSPEYKGVRALGAESYDPGLLPSGSTYYWRIDEVDNANAVSKGPLWSFTTGTYLLVEDFESYNDIEPPGAGSNRIFDKWLDGYGTTTNGAVVGNNLPPYAEQRIIHGGKQSMPYTYDTNLKFSEATLTLAPARDWTAQGVTTLSLWLRGASGNTAERIYIALNGTAVVYNDDTTLTQKTTWTKWVIPLQQFADQGVNLANITSITIGLGTKGNTSTAGGAGKMYFDDVRLY